MWHHVVFFTMNPQALTRLTVISAFFYTEDVFSFFCDLLSPFLLFLKPKSLVWTKTVFEKCLSVLTGCELRDRILLANPAWASHHSHFENLSLAPSFSPSLYVREERDGPYERSGKGTFTIYNEFESTTLFPVSETCCYDVSSSHKFRHIQMLEKEILSLPKTDGRCRVETQLT